MNLVYTVYEGQWDQGPEIHKTQLRILHKNVLTGKWEFFLDHFSPRINSVFLYFKQKRNFIRKKKISPFHMAFRNSFIFVCVFCFPNASYAYNNFLTHSLRIITHVFQTWYSSRKRFLTHEYIDKLNSHPSKYSYIHYVLSILLALFKLFTLLI